MKEWFDTILAAFKALALTFADANVVLGVILIVMLTLQTVLLIRASRDPKNPLRLAKMLLNDQGKESASIMCGIMLFEACVWVFILCGIKGQMTAAWFNVTMALAVMLVLGMKYLDMRRALLTMAGVAPPNDPDPPPATTITTTTKVETPP